MAKKKSFDSRSTAKGPLESGFTSDAPQIWWQNSRTVSLILFALAFVLYFNTLHHDFTLDDPLVITENMYTTKGISGIKDIWTHDSFFGYFKTESKAQLVAGGRYRPFTATLFATGWQLFGNSPLWGHFFNIFWYALTCSVLYLVLLKIFKNHHQKHAIAALTALLFAVHPLHSEAVANIKGLDEIMTLLLSLGAVWFSVKAFDQSDGNTRSNNILASVLFFFALTAKENAIMFVFIVPLIYHFFRQADLSKIVQQSLYFILPAAVFLLIRGAIIGWKFQTTQGELMNNPFINWDGSKYVLMSFSEKLPIIIFTLGKYLALLLAPVNLTHDYYPRQIAVMGFGNWEVWLSLAAYIVLTVFSFRFFKTKNPIGFAILFYGFTLAIVSNLFFPIGTNMGERFVFMPSVGFCLAVALLVSQLGQKQFSIASSMFVAVIVLFGYKTISRNEAWKDNFTLFRTDIRVSQNSAKLRNALGGELIAQAQKIKDVKTQTDMFDEAMVHLQRAVEIHPKYQNAYLLLGNAYNYKRNFDKAIENYNKCLEIEPGYEDAKHNLAITYRYYGIYYLQEKKDVANAVRCLEEMYRLQPDDIESIRMMGKAAGLRGDQQKAAEYFNAVIRKNPKDVEAYNDLSIAYGLLNNPEKANEMKQKAMQLVQQGGGK